MLRTDPSWPLAAVLISATACGDDGRAASGASDGGTTGTTTATTDTGGTATGQPTTGIDTGGTATTTAATTAVDPTGSTGATTGTTGTTGDPACGDRCPGGFFCKYEQCLPNLGTCQTHDDCPGDSYCDPDGQCIPYDVPEGVINDPDCTKPAIPEGVTPALQCEWKGPLDPNDPTKNYTQIYTTPTIADLNLDLDPGKLQPSIVVTTFHVVNGERIGMLRVFDGRTCEEQIRAGGVDEPNLDNRPGYAATWAIGDLDNDVPDGGHPELVSYHLPSNDDNTPVQLYAFRVLSDGVTASLERMWYGRDCDTDTVLDFASGTTVQGPLLIDLDDDEFPEILVGQQVFDADGCLLTTWNASSANGMHAVADVDLDGVMDLVTPNRVLGWDTLTTEWVLKPWFSPDPGQLGGYVGVADVGLYSAVDGVDPAQQPEVVVLSSPGLQGQIRIQSLDGAIVWGPIPTYKTGNHPEDRSGPITISDFDGDGQVEFASAGASQYVVYDPDCVEALMGMSPPERPGGKCERSPEQQAKNLPDGVLWAQGSKDESSNITGSSIFDFDGDGAGEAVYRDECFLRVYDGKSGAVLFSTPASSGTGLDYPTIADVDGDFATEIVVPRTPHNACPGISDPLFPDSGTFFTSTGFAVYRDPQDRWANSRPIWNQHVYSVTHVTDDGRVPRASEYVNNWQSPGLNNLRQNSQGDLGLLQIADLTVELTDLGNLCEFGGGSKDLQAEVCNRGTNPVQDGVLVHFLETATPDQDVSEAVIACTANTSKLLLPGECEVVGCTAMLLGTGNLFVDVDPEDTIADCHPGNNFGADAFGLCPG